MITGPPPKFHGNRDILPDRKIFFGTAALLIAVTAVGVALTAGGAIAEAPTTGAAVPAAGAGSHLTPDHIGQPR